MSGQNTIEKELHFGQNTMEKSVKVSAKYIQENKIVYLAKIYREKRHLR